MTLIYCNMCWVSGNLQVWANGVYVWTMSDFGRWLHLCLVRWSVSKCGFLPVTRHTNSWRCVSQPSDIVSKCMLCSLIFCDVDIFLHLRQRSGRVIMWCAVGFNIICWHLTYKCMCLCTNQLQLWYRRPLASRRRVCVRFLVVV